MKLGGWRNCVGSNHARQWRERRRRAALAAAVVAVGFSSKTNAITYTAADTFSLSPAGATISSAAGIFGTEQVGGFGPDSTQNALLWNGTAASAVNLNPAGFANSFAAGIYGNQQVGYGKTAGTAGSVNALKWAGSAGSFVNLNPIGFTSSHAMATNGAQQVGDGIGTPTGGNDHAILWSGTAASFVDLNPAGYGQSEALSISGGQEVGEGSLLNGNENALLWFGATTAGFVNLNPTGFTVSVANGNSGGQQVGSGYGTATLFNQHALLWSGTAVSAVDLNTAGFTQTEALATNSAQQVGDGFGTATGSNVHALVWSGTAGSLVDLNAIVPGSATFSFATAIDLYGNIAGFAQTASNTFSVDWLAGDTYNAAANGTAWNSQATWLSGVPASGNDVLLISSDGAKRTISYANSNSSLVLGTVTIDALNGGSTLLSQSQDTLGAKSVNVGGSGIAAGGVGILTVSNSATFSVSGPLRVWNKGRVNLDVPVSNVGNIVIVGNGIVNVNGALKINYGTPANDPVAAVAGYLQSGYNGGAWTGTAGIISTSAQNQTGPILSVGYADGNTDAGTSAGANQIVVKYTLAGDANLDGLVNFNDLVAVVQNFNKSGSDWADGNFTYSTSTSFNDLVIVVQNFNKTLPPPSGSAVELSGTTIPLLPDIQPTVVRLPEPGVAVLAGVGAAGLLVRRRRRPA